MAAGVQTFVPLTASVTVALVGASDTIQNSQSSREHLSVICCGHKQRQDVIRCRSFRSGWSLLNVVDAWQIL